MGIKHEFNDVAKDYDAQRRQLIPCFDDFYRLPIEMLDCQTDAPRVLDVGGGTGLASAFLLEKYPNARLTLIDLAEGMLDIARERFAGNENVEYIVADYTTHPFDEPFDIIISALSIHHLNAAGKEALYKKCYGLLKSGGIFLNADQVKSPFLYTEEMFTRLWREEIEASGIGAAELQKAYERQAYDDTSTLCEQLKWLENAGFSVVDCAYKYYVFAVLYAKK